LIVPLLALLPVLDPAPIPIRAGTPVTLDGKVEESEWADALSVTRPMPRMAKYPDEDRNVVLRVKRTGPWLAIAVSGDKQFDGEIVRLFVTDRAGAYVTGMVLGLGNAPYPPAIWRRGPKTTLTKMLPESPRCCLARLDVKEESHWGAEYLVALRGLGIGKGDVREFKGLFTVTHPENGDYVVVPEGAQDPLDPSSYAPFAVADGWGGDETWPEPGPEASAEYDDHELLHRLFLEFARVSMRTTPDRLVISDAVRPRSLNKIEALERQLEAAERRNPTLPAWLYYRARLCHEANLFSQARALIDAIPRHLLAQEAFANLVVEHFLDLEDVERADAVLATWPNPALLKESRYAVGQLKLALDVERQAIEADAAKVEKNPVVRLETDKGEILCELFEDDAVNGVRNFMNLVLEQRYYDGMRFDWVAGGIAARTGDPRSRSAMAGDLDGPDWRLVQDKPKRPMLRGRLAMMPFKRGIMHGSKFVITVAPALHDEADAEVFGRVIKGQEVVDSLEQDDRLLRVVVVEQRRHAYEPRGRIR